MKKLNVLGSVLYIAAHPDDENTRLLAYFANEKLYRTGYLSLTRGDGGQNLIGDEQGIDLGLIRTQELLAARRIDGAEQFFSRAFDFGFSKNPEEALRIWGHEKILSDVVWVIRKFRPDVIITRFPTTGEGGHGHHTASAILAEEAFDAAGDPTKFPEQLIMGVKTWQAKRLLWNTFNFGTTNTQRDDQFKIDAGGYNVLLGKSYGEIAALSRSQHKSQGFGVPAQRGVSIEYFKTIKGSSPVNDLMDGINTGWDRTLFGGQLISRPLHEDNAQHLVDSIIRQFLPEHPENSLQQLIRLYGMVGSVNDSYWNEQKLGEIKKLIEACSGLFMEAISATPYGIQGDSVKLNFVINNRLGIDILSAKVMHGKMEIPFPEAKKNTNLSLSWTGYIEPGEPITQPYWLEQPMDPGSFNVADQERIGMAENDPMKVDFHVTIGGAEFVFSKPVRYKFTDPVKGEIYQPVGIVPPMYFSSYSKLIIRKYKDGYSLHPTYSLKTAKFLPHIEVIGFMEPSHDPYNVVVDNVNHETGFSFTPEIKNYPAADTRVIVFDKIKMRNTIQYDHIPQLAWYADVKIKVLDFGERIKTDGGPVMQLPKSYCGENLKTDGTTIGYINGAGDKIPEALEQMGYKVIFLKEKDITSENIRKLDAIITGVRAYNTNEWMNNVYEVLMKYVKEGGTLLVQYNTSNQIGPVRAKIAPYPFTISRTRVTDENAQVKFLLPGHPLLNYPNTIIEDDFKGWVQERSIYHAEAMDSNYQRLFSMADPGEKETDGSLIAADYGKGRFIYTGLVFYRELPAGVPGAFRLLANFIARRK